LIGVIGQAEELDDIQYGAITWFRKISDRSFSDHVIRKRGDEKSSSVLHVQNYKYGYG
jgi:hypothetical protein